MLRSVVFLLVCMPILASGEVRKHSAGKEIPHDAYLRLISETDSPVEKVYITTKDGLYVPAAIRKPKGNGPFPTLVYFHGAPGGRGMQKLVDWAIGSTGSPVWERFLREGYVVVVGDYRKVGNLSRPITPEETTLIDDGISTLEHVRTLPYVDKERIFLYGVSLGGNVVAHMINRTTVTGAILGAPALDSFLGTSYEGGARPRTAEERAKLIRFNPEYEKKQIAPVKTPVLVLVGTADPLQLVSTRFHDAMEAAGKPVRMELYENGYHDFCIGPQGHVGFHQPLMEGTLDALERTLEFTRNGIK